MNYIQAIILGLIQGVCEFLPISSSGHLVIFQTIFGMDTGATDNILFNVLLHLSTLLSVCIVFRKRILKIIIAFIGLIGDIFKGKFSFKNCDGDKKMVILVLVATIPLFIAALFEEKLEVLFSSLMLSGIALLVTAALLILSDVVCKKIAAHSRAKTAKDFKIMDGVVVGLFQCVALIPGISRSGSTITAGLIRNFDRNLAVEFSFILSIPAVLGSVVLKLSGAIDMLANTNLGPCFAGMAVALVAGLASIKLVKFIVNKNQFGKFAYYCIAAGLFAIGYYLFF